MKTHNNKSGFISLVALVAITAAGVGGTYVFQDHKAIQQLNRNQQAMGQQIDRNTSDIDLIGNHVARYNTPAGQPTAKNWRDAIIPNGNGGLQ
jgi:hypothetical protein